MGQKKSFRSPTNIFSEQAYESRRFPVPKIKTDKSGNRLKKGKKLIISGKNTGEHQPRN